MTLWKGLDDVLADGRGVERAFQCHMHDDRHASASVNVQTGLWICYACDARGRLEDHVPDPASVVRALSDEDEVRYFPEEWLDLFDAHSGSRYWIDRLGEATADHFRCGIHPVTGHPTYPLRDLDGAVMGVVSRREDEDPKYKYPYGPRTSRTLFSSRNRLEPSSVLILVEGAPDVMALHAAGLPPRWQAAGTFGAGLHAPQVEAIADTNPALIVFGFDSDEAGFKATERAEIQCDGLAPAVSVAWSTVSRADGKPAKDAGDVPIEHRIAVITEAIHHHGMERFA